jgi:4-amino-4-deoxy-L-arabinose transferase-like glycosyltransferase
MPGRRVPAYALPLTILGCFALYLLANGRVAIWDRDEPRYAMASRYMLHSGDWVVPRMGWGADPTVPRTAKPALIYWLQAGAMSVFGDGTFGARFPSAMSTTVLLCILGTVISKYLSRAHAFWTVLILGTSAMVVVGSKMCIIDPTLLLFITIAQLCLYALYRGPKPLWVSVLMWVALGLGGLAKGPVALAIPATTAVVLLALDYFRKRLLDAKWLAGTRPLVGLLILAAVCGPWLYLVSQRSPGFLMTAVRHDVVERVQHSLEEHTGPPGYYLAGIFGTFFPWSLLIPLTIVLAWSRMRRLPTVRFAVAAVIGPWILMECVQTKLVHYVLPIFPALSFLAADAVVRCLRKRHDGLTNWVVDVGAAVFGVAVVAIAAYAPWAVVRHAETGSFPHGVLVAMSAVATLYGFAVFAFFKSRLPTAALLTMGAGMAIYIAIAFGLFLPAADFLRLSPRIAATLTDLGATGPGAALMTGYKEQSLPFYQGGTIDECWANFLSETPPEKWPPYFVLTPEVLEKAPAARVAQLDRLAEFRGLNYAGGSKWVTVYIVRPRRTD